MLSALAFPWLADANPTPQIVASASPSPIPGIERISDREAVEGLARLQAPFKADHVQAVVSGNWGFVDVARKDPKNGQWAESVSGLYRRVRGRWGVLKWGDPMDWGGYKKQMTSAEAKAFDRWHAGHF